MDLSKYSYFENYMASEFQVVCYNYQNIMVDFEHYILNNFYTFDSDFYFESDGGLSFLLISEPVYNATNLNQFTNFKPVLNASRKFVNVKFVYSIKLTHEDVDIFVDVYIQNGKILGDKCVGCLFDDTIVT